MTGREWKHFIFILMIFISAAIETDIYLPAFPDMMVFFSTSEEVIQSLLTWNFFGICISAPFYGPISDAWGRKKPLLVALSLFFLGSLITLFAHEFNWMLWGRLLQGFGSGGCFTLGTTILFDFFNEKKALAAIANLNTLVPFTMSIAPMIGGFLNYHYGFRSNFLTIALFVFASLSACTFFLKETLPATKRKPLVFKKVLRDFFTVLSNLSFWQATLVMSLVFSGYISFLSVSSVLFVLELGIDKASFPFFQFAVLSGWLVASMLCSRAADRWGKERIKKIGVSLIALGALGFSLSAIFNPLDPYFPTLMMVAYSYGANWSNSLYFPEVMGLFPDIRGVAASSVTCVRLLLTASIVGAASKFYDGSIYPLAITIALAATFALLCAFSYERRKLASS